MLGGMIASLLREHYRAARHRARCRSARADLLSRMADTLGDLDADSGCPGVPEAYWAAHLVGQWPRAGLLAERPDDDALRDAIALLTNWMMLTSWARGAAVAHDTMVAVEGRLGVERRVAGLDCEQCLQEVHAILGREPATDAIADLVALCEVALSELTDSINGRWALVEAMLIGDGRLSIGADPSTGLALFEGM